MESKVTSDIEVCGSPPEIYRAIPKVMADVGAIGKDGFNSYDKYNFRSIDDVYNKLQPALSKHGVFFVPNILESIEEELVSGKGNKQRRVKLKVEYKVFAHDGSCIRTVVEGEGIDRGDKAINKALTAAFKYMVIQLFCIAVEGMVDSDNESPEQLKVSDAQPKKDVKNHAPQKSKNTSEYIIPEGKFKGKRVRDVSEEDLQNYIYAVESALTEQGKDRPSWFSELLAATS